MMKRKRADASSPINSLIPSTVRGPVERSHGRKPLIATGCAARRSGLALELETGFVDR